MKTFGIILFVAAGLMKVQAAEDAAPVEATNAIIISTEYINALVAEAQTNSPSLKAADARVRSATFGAEAVRTWDDPTFIMGGNVFSQQGFSSSVNGDLIYGLQEKLPLWGMPSLNRQIATASMSRQEAKTAARVQQLRQEITKALISAALMEQVITAEEHDLGWFQTISQSVEAKYQAGQVDGGDTLQIQNAVAEQNDLLQTDRLELDHDRFVLNRLLNRRQETTWPSLRLPSIAPAVPYSDKLIELAVANEPNLKVEEQEIKQAQATAKRTQRARLPDVGFGVQGWQYSGDGGFRQGMFTLSVSLPWFNGDKYRKDYARDRENVESAQQEREDRVLLVREELHRFTIELDAQRRQALLYQNGISLRAGQALADKENFWQTGRGTLREVLDARRDLLDAQLMTARATAAQYQTLADLMLWAGLKSFEALTSLAHEPALFPNQNIPAN
jgi:cobalt-zinc-cadmium efflux system outer membrane protein